MEIIIPAGTLQKYDTLKIKNVPIMKTNEHLFHFLPFLRNDYRQLKKNELQSEETFKELFPDEEIDLTKLEQIYNFQNIVTVTETPSEIVVDYSAGHIRAIVTEKETKTSQVLDRKIVKNGKV